MVLVLIAAPLSGCCQDCRTKDGTPPPLPSYADIASAQNARVSAIDRVYADGSIELRWVDEDGEHFAPGQIELWIEPPDRTAIYVFKGGERIMWLGSNGPLAWLFDFRGKDTVLHVTRSGDDATSGLPFNPARLFGVAGLGPLPPEGTVEGFDEGRDAYVVLADPADGPQRLFVDRRSLLPVRVEILDADGTVLLFGELALRRYQRVEVIGAPGTGPLIPTLIDIHGISGDAHAKLSLYEPTSDETVMEPDYFDLDWLMNAYPPQRVEGLSPLAAGP
jgi:hypothetical protein